MAKRQTTFAIVIVLLVSIGYRNQAGCAQEPEFSSNTPYLTGPQLPESERKKLIRLAASEPVEGRTDNRSGEMPPAVASDSAAQDTPLPAGPAADGVTKAAVVSELEQQRVGVRAKTARSGPGDPADPARVQDRTFFLRYLGSLLLVVGLIVGLAWLYRRVAGVRRPGGGAVQILSRTAINGRQSICLVKVGTRLLVVGLSAGHMTTLDTLDDPDEVGRLLGAVERDLPGSISSLHGFRGMFRRESQEYDPQTPADTIVDYGDNGRPLWQEAREELAGLVGKVRGLARIRPRD